MEETTQASLGDSNRGVVYWFKFLFKLFCLCVCMFLFCKVSLNLLIFYSGKLNEIQKEFSAVADPGVKKYFKKFLPKEGNAKNMQDQLLQLAGLPKGIFTHQQVEQIFGMKFNVQQRPSQSELYEYQLGLLRLALYYEKNAIFVYNWDEANPGQENIKGDCIDRDAFVDALEQKGWKRFYSSFDELYIGEGVRLFNYQEPRRWMMISARELAWLSESTIPQTYEHVRLNINGRELGLDFGRSTQVVCISRIVIYDTK